MVQLQCAISAFTRSIVLLPKSAIATCSVFGDRTLVHAGMNKSANLMTTRSGATSCERKRQYSGCRYRFGAIICRSARLGNRGRATRPR
jgi:hypothetical protein